MRNPTRATSQKEAIFFIPARGGSKSLPGKNLARINNQSILELAIRSIPQNLILRSEAIVSSDEQRILSEAKKFGVRAIKRSDYASSDAATAKDVLEDLLNQEDVKDVISENTIIIYLQPTSPLRRKNHVFEALELYEANGIPVVSVTKISEYPQKMLQQRDDGLLQSYISDFKPTSNRQDFAEILIPNGAIYIFKVSDFRDFSGIPIQGAIPYFMNQEDSVDIDTHLDLTIARELFKSQSL
jgi:CMP-N-acetylneuraminic acid synthetase